MMREGPAAISVFADRPEVGSSGRATQTNEPGLVFPWLPPRRCVITLKRMPSIACHVNIACARCGVTHQAAAPSDSLCPACFVPYRIWRRPYLGRDVAVLTLSSILIIAVACVALAHVHFPTVVTAVTGCFIVPMAIGSGIRTRRCRQFLMSEQGARLPKARVVDGHDPTARQL